MNAVHNEVLPPSGVEHAVSLKLTSAARTGQSALSHLVVARQNFLRVFEVRVEAAPLPTQAQLLASDHARTRRGMEAVEGEVEMDVGGEGFVNVAPVKSTGSQVRHVRTVTRLYLLCQHHLYGTVTGLARVRTTASIDDGLDRLIVSCKDAKLALLEWSEQTCNLNTVSIHTYERAPQMMVYEPSRAIHQLRVDPSSRCAALTLPQDAIAVLPFNESQADLDVDMDTVGISREVPYAPSFVLSFPEIDQNIRNIIDFIFLPGLNNPTIAVLFQTQQTWTSRLEEFKDTVSLRLITLDLVTRSYPVITSVDGLPYDSLMLLACPAAVGGVVVISSNAIFHIEQGGKTVGVAVNGWARRVSDFPLPAPTRDDALEGSHCVFISDRTIMVVLRDGTIMPVELIADGRNIGKIEVGEKLAQTTTPALVHAIRDDLVFIGSAVGPSVLVHVVQTEDTDAAGSLRTVQSLAALDEEGDQVMDSDDDDLYGGIDLKSSGPFGAVSTTAGRQKVLRLGVADSLFGHGPLLDITFILGRNGDKATPQLLAGAGAGRTGGLMLYHRDFPAVIKRKLHKISGSFGIWSFPLRRSMKIAGMSIERQSTASDLDTVVFSTDATPSPGLSRLAIRDDRDDAEIISRYANVTVGAGPFFQRTAILQVTTNAIRVLEADGSERQNIKDLNNTTPHAKIKACSISDPYVVVVREDGSLGLFIGETGKGKMRRKDMSALGDKASRYLAASFYQDQSGLFKVAARKGSTQGTAAMTIETAMDEGRGSQWLLLCRPQGVIEIWTLPKLTLAFSCDGISTVPYVLSDSFESVTPSPAEELPRSPQDLDVEEILIAPIGDVAPTPHLFIGVGRDSMLQLVFIRVLSTILSSGPAGQLDKRGPPAQRHLITFNAPLHGVFITGNEPVWVYATNHSAVKCTHATNAIVHSFSPCSVWGKRGQFLLYTDEGPCLIEWSPNLTLDENLPAQFIPRGRAYTSVAFEPATGLVVAASSLRSRFDLFDEDGNKVWQPDGEYVSDPQTDTSTLELIDPTTWTTVAGFEFPFNEFINVVRPVNLETSSAEAGSKEFVTIGTTVFRGEDLAVKGAIYIFEVVEVVPNGAQRQFKLRLLCRDEAKGPVSALCGINGYLVNSIGQKIFVRAFEQDERLVGVAFMDVGIYVTSLRSLKNLLLIGDAVKSVWFCAFQEDPFKLIPIGKDFQHVSLTTAEFFFAFGDMAIATTDELGVLRLLRYDPTHADSLDGQRLIYQTEFFQQADTRSAVTILRRSNEDAVEGPRSQLIYAGTDGSLAMLIPVDESTSKRLHLLSGQLTRNVQHIAGLNPRAFRVVRNDHVSRPLAKGILDGILLNIFHDLPPPKQAEFTKQIGTTRETILADLHFFQTAW
ncbi:CPSF A subunit region-domain-containing protein [Auriculariales sp. MPI-PUGE-AT-0066]|nr:CPSF A subunit region-domain-containing protein [Auriculariales sp. MPI-PUGE-AT-0066]